MRHLSLFTRIPSGPARFVARCLVALSLIAAVGLAAPNAAPSASAQSGDAPVAPSVNPDGTLSLSSGLSGALDLRGWNVTLDSQRGPILARQSRAAPAAAKSSTIVRSSDPLSGLADLPQPPSFWLPLPNGGLSGGQVYALAVSGSDLYVGGTFNATNDGAVTNLNNIAKFNTISNTWSALPHNGLSSVVYALAVIGSDLYVGGSFATTADGMLTMYNIAKFSGGAWSALPHNGLNGNVYALAASGGNLYVGGQFTSSADYAVFNLINIAKLAGGAWSALPNLGLNNYVYALAGSGSDLYVGGQFTQTVDGVVTKLNHIAKFSSGAWSALDHEGLDSTVYALAASGTDIYVGGAFAQTADGAVANLNHIAHFKPSTIITVTTTPTWLALPHNGLNNNVNALAVSGGQLYVGGIFNQTADSVVGDLSTVAHFSTISNTWLAPPNKGLYLAGQFSGVKALAVSSSALYVGGGFFQTVDHMLTNLRGIAKLTNDTDGDGIPDDWERNGVTINGVFIDLPGMGANPLHKDLFVHADWMNAAGLKPDARDIKIVSDAFDQSPLTNPDGTTGVHLHVDLGPDSIMDPVKGTLWGARAVAKGVPYRAAVGSTTNNVYDWTEFDALKQIDFNGSQRAAVFHYMCFCSTLGGMGRTSGLARGIPGHDFLVTLGVVSGGTSLQKAGTFMHELGHNLGLHHGGADDVNFKPNFLSVMNYSFQFIGLPFPFLGHIVSYFDYSRRQLPTLDETGLAEGIGINDPDGHLTFWNAKQLNGGCQSHLDNYFVHLNYPGADWDCNGALTPGSAVADINGDGVCIGPGLNGVSDTSPSGDDLLINSGFIIAGSDRTCDTTAAGDDVQLHPVGFQEPNALTGFDDWSAVVFDAGNQIGQPPRALSGPTLLAPSDVMTTTVDELTYDQISSAVPPVLFNAEASAPIDVVSYSPASGSAPLHVGFNGAASTTPTGTVTAYAWDFGDNTVGSGAIITHTYSVVGTYFATLRVTNSGGNVNLVALRHRVSVGGLAKLFLPLVRR